MGARFTVLLATGLAAALVSCGGEKKPPTPQELKPEQKVRIAENLLKAGRSNDALVLLQEAVDTDPKNAGLRNYLGQVAFLAGRYPVAESSFKKALEIDPYLTDVYNNLGALYAKTDRKDEAEKAFRRVLEDPAYPRPEKAWMNLGVLYGSQGRDNEAVASLRKAVEIDPKYYGAQFELASVLDRNDKLEEAARLYEVAEPDFAQSGEYQYRLGFVYFRLKRYEKAREHLARAIDVAPGSENSAKASELLKLIR